MSLENISYKSLKWIYSLSICFVLICAALMLTYHFGEYSIPVQPNVAQQITEKETVEFINKTNSFLIENSEVIGKELKLTLKNNYDKSINGFYITVGPKEDGVSYNIELLYSEVKDEIRPGEIFICHISYDKKLQNNGFVLQAVLFTDDSGSGEPDFIQEMKDMREGERAQFKKGLELLERLKDSKPEDSFDLEKLKLEVASLETEETKKSHYYNYGLTSGRGNLIRYIEKIQKNESQNELTAEQKISQFKTKLEEFVSTP